MSNEFDPLAEIQTQAISPTTPTPTPESLILQVTESKVVPEDSSDVPYVSPYTEITDTAIVDNNITQMLPNVYSTAEEMDNDITKIEQQLKDKSGTPSKEDLNRLNDAISIYSSINYGFFENNEYGAALNTTPNTFVQYLVGDKGKNVRIGYPSFKIKDDVETLEGPVAMRYLSKLTAVGNVTVVPLWHSGLKLTLNVFKEQALLDLNIKLARQRVLIGNNTRGASFTGDDVHTVNVIVDFILDHVIDSNLKNHTTARLRKLILVTDIPALLCGALSAIYPGGYPVAHSCINTMNNTCDYNISPKRKEDGDYEPESLLDFTKLLWVDRSRVGSSARSFMSDDTKKYTNEEIINYQAQLYGNLDKALGKKIYTRGNVGITVVFKVPTISEYIVTCNNWVERIMTMVDSAIALDTDLSGDERKEKRGKLLNSYAYTLDLLKYENWIDYFKVSDEDGIVKTITSPDAIRESLEVFSGIDKFKENFEKAVQIYKEEITLAFTGLPNFKCPNCGAGQVEPNSKHPTLIPVNMVGYFFIIMVRRGMIRQQTG